jgi:hypothetical protein
MIRLRATRVRGGDEVATADLGAFQGRERSHSRQAAARFMSSWRIQIALGLADGAASLGVRDRHTSPGLRVQTSSDFS